MGEHAATLPARKASKSILECRIRHRVGRAGPSPTSGEIEIENVSPNAIDIEVSMHPLQFLNLVITDAAGNLLPAAPYGDLFSPCETPYILSLAPGEKFTHNVSLLGTLPKEKQLPGSYSVRAVFEYNGFKAVSDPLKVQIPAEVG
jgi:hypothetical protein